MSTPHRVDHERVIAGLLNDDPAMLRRYHTSAAFRHRLDYLPVYLAAMVDGLAEAADGEDAAARAAIAAYEAGDLLTRDELAASYGRAVGADTRLVAEAARARAEADKPSWSEPPRDTGRIAWAGVIAVEGEPTCDGRDIAHDALHWSPPVRLNVPGHRPGVVSRIWRDGGGLIRAQGDCEPNGWLARLLRERDTDGVGVAVGLSEVQWVETRTRDVETLTCSYGRVCEVTVVEDDAECPWSAARIHLPSAWLP